MKIFTVKRSTEVDGLKELVSENKKRNDLYQKDLDTKDRVDISKNEYLSLLNEIKNLKENNEHMKNTLHTMFFPFLHEEGGEALITNVLEGKAKIENVKISQMDNPRNFTTKLYIVYEVEK